MTKRNVLDHGYVKFIEDWGRGESNIPEAGIIEAARMSTAKGFEGWEKDERLLNYLYSHKHMTPFEMAGMVIEVQAPIFVFREWHRHRTQSYNEMSARYIPLPDVNYVPSIQRLMINQGSATTNKQAQSTGATLKEAGVSMFLTMLEEFYKASQDGYKAGLDLGVPKELARLFISVGRYSRMRASANLRNWLAFLTLRMDPAAQWEIRQFANVVGEIISYRFPRTWDLFVLGDSK